MCAQKNLRLTLMQMIADISDVRPLTPETPVDLTSLQQVEFVMELEERFNVAIHDEPEWETVEDVARWLEEQNITV